MKSREKSKLTTPTREGQRFSHLRGLSIVYEGDTKEIAVHAPDISPRGMFINTPHHFPEGAVLKSKFVLTNSGVEVCTRCEVRYCLPGVGVGVEFVEISPEAREAIEQEVGMARRKAGRREESE
jgi:hypothetical protein